MWQVNSNNLGMNVYIYSMFHMILVKVYHNVQDSCQCAVQIDCISRNV